MEDTKKHFHLFNCDKTYNLAPVEALLSEMKAKGKLSFDISIVQHCFDLPMMSEVCDSKIPELQMDVAVFAVHAHESRLSINEENAGIGYARIYRALLQKTGEHKQPHVQLYKELNILFIRIVPLILHCGINGFAHHDVR